MGFEYQTLASGRFHLPDGWKISTIKEVADVNALSITKKAAPSFIDDQRQVFFPVGDN